MTQTIYRTKKDKDNPYVMIDKRILANPKLSWKAKGIWTYLMSKPDDWEVILADIEKRSTDQNRAVRSGLQELRDAGYIWKAQERDETGQITKHLWLVFEQPQMKTPKITGATLTKRKNGKDTILTFSTNGLSTCGKKQTTNNEVNNKDDTKKSNDASASRKLLKHPAMKAYRSVVHFHVHKAWRDKVAQIVGESEKDIEKWDALLNDWIGFGWSPRNIKGMLERFQNGDRQISAKEEPRRKAEQKYGGD